MTLQEFENLISKDEAQQKLTPPLLALWHDGQGNWNAAHDLVDSSTTVDACWVHAYLHRKEGDQWNAKYWYNRAGRSIPNTPLEEEWEQLVLHFLG
ncbi:MAG: hypothetical protein OEQ53_10380 [Saprospiraceae bacterium]|nr:hypothetical protein [Saprospiraceae bacterium]